MAGIQFELGAYLNRKTISQQVVHEASKAVQSIGTWWSTVVFLTLLAWAARLTLTGSYAFYTIFTYAVVLSMLIAAPINAMTSNYLSDPIFLGDYHPVTSELTGALFVGTLLGFGLGFGLAFLFSSQALHVVLIFASLTSILTALWIVNNIMAILKKEKVEFIAFLIGFAIAYVLFLFIRRVDLLAAMLATVTTAFAITVFFEYAYIMKGFNRGRIEVTFNFLLKMSRGYIILAFFFFTLGLWVDKIVFWFTPETAQPIDDLFRFSNYDWPFFVGFSIFSISHLLIFRNVQTLILDPYKEFTNSLAYNLPFKVLTEKKLQLIAGYRTVIDYVVQIYGPLLLLIFILTSFLKVEFPWKNPFTFHHILFATFFFSFYSINFILLQYIKCYKVLALTAFLFFAVNGSVTWLIIRTGQINLYGLGFAFASIAATLLSSAVIHRILGGWEYYIFEEVADDF